MTNRPIEPGAAALVGLGSMGYSIAANLIRAGVDLAVHDRVPERIGAMVRLGAHATDLAGIAARPAVLLSLPGPTQVDDVCATLLPRMAPGAVLVNTSTIGVAQARELARQAAERDIEYVDAPVTGAADGARAGQLVFMIGASTEALARVRPLLEPLSHSIHHVGAPGAGTAAKLLTNRLWFTHVVALADTLALGALEGLDPATFGELIRASAGGSWVAEHDLPNLLAGNDDESFSLALCTKDLRLIAELAATHAYADPLAAIARQRFDDAAARFGPTGGELAVARLAEEAAGVSIRAQAPGRP